MVYLSLPLSPSLSLAVNCRVSVRPQLVLLKLFTRVWRGCSSRASVWVPDKKDAMWQGSKVAWERQSRKRRGGKSGGYNWHSPSDDKEDVEANKIAHKRPRRETSKEEGRDGEREAECKQEANKWNLIIKSNASSETGQKHSTNLTKSSEIKQNKVKQNEKRNKNENETKRGGTREKTKTFKYPINV